MGTITLQQAAAWCGGKIDPKYHSVTFCGANNDTRKIAPGELFLALKGVRDGHDFIPAALEKGAAAVLCTHCDGDYPAIVVEDVRVALGQIAKRERQRLGCKVVAITGSVGKSTTKEMIATVLGSTYRVSKTPANHNNDIGLPMAVLAMPEDTQVAVLEMGMNHFGELSYLTDIAQPNVAVIINIGTMHIENLGSVDGILQAKLEILEGLQPGGSVIFNGDDPKLWKLHVQMPETVYFGAENARSKVLAGNIRENETICYDVLQPVEFSVELPLQGEHYIPDSLAAIAVGLELGVKPVDIAMSLGTFQNMAGRQEEFRAGEYTIIKDCYNAGPESMAAALAVLSKKTGRRVAVLGEMLELGACTAAEHYKVGRLAAERADMVLAYGPSSDRVLKGAITGGMPDTRVKAYEDREKLIAALKQLAKPGDVFLFKGSHGMHMELILEAFLREEK